MILAILTELRIRHLDLEEALVRALAAGVNVTEREDDPWHPSSQAADYFAALVRSAGVL
jgi:hypothetical protein